MLEMKWKRRIPPPQGDLGDDIASLLDKFAESERYSESVAITSIYQSSLGVFKLGTMGTGPKSQ